MRSGVGGEEEGPQRSNVRVKQTLRSPVVISYDIAYVWNLKK